MDNHSGCIMRHVFCFFCLCLFVSACDCVQEASGIVLDKTTGLPLDSVAIGKLGKEDPSQPYSYLHVYTDSTGRYEYGDISGGLFGCPDLKLFFFKNGYETTGLTFPSATQNDTVYLEPVR